MPGFCFNDAATTEIYTLSLHDALPISPSSSEQDTAEMSIFLNENSKVIVQGMTGSEGRKHTQRMLASGTAIVGGRSEEHTSELQSRQYLVCRLLLEKKITTRR